MTRVLLLADTERVQRIFHDLAEQGVLQLQVASTLALGEAEIAASPPDFTFVQSRISGFSGDILLRHLDKHLPNGACLLLLAGEAEDAAQAKKHGRVALDLSQDDESLERSIRALLAGEPLPAPATAGASPVGRPAPGKTKTPVSDKTVSADPGPASEPIVSEHPAAEPSAAPPELEPQLPELEPQLPPAVEPSPVAAEPAGASSPFEELMLRASAEVAPLKLEALEVEEWLAAPAGAPGSDEPTSAAAGTATGQEAGDPSPAPFVGESVASALRRAEQHKPKRRPYLIIVPVLALLAIPLFSYLAGKRTGPEAPAAQVQTVTPAPVATAPPAAPPTTASGKQPGAGTAPSPRSETAPHPQNAAANPPAAQTVKQEPQAPRPRGRADLPPMLEGTRLDADYGKSHPGWVRYVGLRGEYKLFKEKDLFKAMQVVAAGGGTIPDELFRKALKEFGGIGAYRVESSSKKGDYLVEQGAAAGDAALTIYRSQKDLKMKGFVVYYR